MKKSILFNSIVFSFLYVGLGTIALLSLDRNFILSGEWAFYALLITMPVSFLGFGYVYMETDIWPELMFIQLGVFILCVLVVNMFLLWKYKKDN